MKSNTKKAFILLAFFVVSLLPLALIYDNLSTRKYNYNSVIAEISHSYGVMKSLSAPLLVVPGVEDGEEIYSFFNALDSEVQIYLKPQVKSRGIYRAVVYQGDAEFRLKFKSDEMKEAQKRVKLDWERASLRLKVDSNASLSVYDKNDKPLSFSMNYTWMNIPLGAFFVDEDILINEAFLLNKEIIFRLSFKGSESFSFVPMGQNEHIMMHSSWKNPSFDGILPDNIEKKDGFSAQWSVRNPEYIFQTEAQAKDTPIKSLEVKLLDSMTEYRLIERSIKYGILFIALTLALFFICDVGLQKRLHILQYFIIGATLVAFYMLLLSLSEQIGFVGAYLVAMLSVVVPTALYAFGIMRDKKFALLVGGALCALYLALLGILKIENYSLLLGSVLLMVVLYFAMFLTRHLRT
ncbi:cell envelope integrity protein CreD [Helicobacter himalayensis]|uniref:cell envelope integrity protein CreD n=1 Tax=Helicobacter himalayensis TaxID=1591088 RepID=UPI00082E0B9C|nr:cell envelope integrity protein CreD [Helicobacter himalayensis]